MSDLQKPRQTLVLSLEPVNAVVGSAFRNSNLLSTNTLSFMRLTANASSEAQKEKVAGVFPFFFGFFFWFFSKFTPETNFSFPPPLRLPLFFFGGGVVLQMDSIGFGTSGSHISHHSSSSSSNL